MLDRYDQMRHEQQVTDLGRMAEADCFVYRCRQASNSPKNQRVLAVWGSSSRGTILLGRDPSSNGTETPIQRLSGRQDGLSATYGLPLLPQDRPSKERIKNDSAMCQEET